MADIGKLTPDSELADNGVWVTYEPWEDFEIKLAFHKTMRVRTAQRKRLQQAFSIQDGEVKPAEEFNQVNMVIETLAREIIIDWRNLENNGEPFPCTYENALTLLVLDLELQDWILQTCHNVELFKRKEMEAAASGCKSDDSVDG